MASLAGRTGQEQRASALVYTPVNLGCPDRVLPRGNPEDHQAALVRVFKLHLASALLAMG